MSSFYFDTKFKAILFNISRLLPEIYHFVRVYLAPIDLSDLFEGYGRLSRLTYGKELTR